MSTSNRKISPRKIALLLLLGASVLVVAVRLALYQPPLLLIAAAGCGQQDAAPPMVTVRADTLAARFRQAYEYEKDMLRSDSLQIVISGMGEGDVSTVCNNNSLLKAASSDCSISYDGSLDKLTLLFRCQAGSTGPVLVRVPTDVLFALVLKLQLKGKS